MPDKKLTDSEIIKALECCANNPNDCVCYESKCPLFGQKCIDILSKNALDLINRLQAENERLKNCVKSEDEVRDIAKRTMEPLVKEITREQIDIAVKQAKVEAYKECIEKAKEQCRKIPPYHFNLLNVEWYLDNLLK